MVLTEREWGQVMLQAITEDLTDGLGKGECFQVTPDYYIIPGYMPDHFVEVKNVSERMH